MFVGVILLAVLVPDSHSLKDKRSVVRRLKDRVRDRFGIPMVEVGALDLHQRAELGFAVAASERGFAERMLSEVEAFVAAEAPLAGARREVITLGSAESIWAGADVDAVAQAFARTGAADKAIAGADDEDAGGNPADAAWLPAEWKEAP